MSEGKENLIFENRKGNVLLVAEKPLQFENGLRRQNKFAFSRFGKIQFLIGQGQPAAIGGDKG